MQPLHEYQTHHDSTFEAAVDRKMVQISQTIKQPSEIRHHVHSRERVGKEKSSNHLVHASFKGSRSAAVTHDSSSFVFAFISRDRISRLPDSLSASSDDMIARYVVCKVSFNGSMYFRTEGRTPTIGSDSARGTGPPYHSVESAPPWSFARRVAAIGSLYDVEF